MTTSLRATLTATVGSFEVDVSLAGNGRPIALVGPNGSGKTTLLRLLAGALPAHEADIAVGDTVLARSSEAIDVPMELRRVGYLPQGCGLFPHLSVLDNVAFGLSTGAMRLPRPERNERARAILAELGCEDLAKRSVAGLSGGEQQQVALARALVIDPALLLLDEPLAALDATTRRAVRGLLVERLRDFAGPTVVVTHDVRDVAALDAEVYVLDEGRVIQHGNLEQLRREPANAFVAEFSS